MKCDNCSSIMEWRVDGSSQGWYCNHCGWDVVTTYVPPIRLDETTYRVFAQGDQEMRPPQNQLKLIARLLLANYLVAKEELSSGAEFLVFEGQAEEALDVVHSLDKAGIVRRVEPDFSQYLDE